MSDFTEATVKAIVSGIRKGLYTEHEGRILLEILTNAGSAAQSLVDNLEQSKHLIVLGTENAGVVMNGAVVASGIYTGGNSAVQYTVTQNIAAKRFYLLSVAFSLSAITNGGVAVLSRACKLSEVGVISEALGAGFMWCGNASQAAALKADGKPIPPELRKSIRRPIAFLNQNNRNGIAFAVPRSCDNIPFQTIGKLIGIGFVIYGYYKLIIVASKSAQRLFDKYQSRRKRLLFQKKLQVLSLMICSSTSYKVSS